MILWKKKSYWFLIFVFIFLIFGDPSLAFRVTEREPFYGDNFISIKLTIPIKNKNSINLYSEDGFSLYYKDSLREMENLNTNYLNIKLSNGELIFSDDYEEFSFDNYEDIVIGSSSVYNSVVKVEDNRYRGAIFILK